MLKPGQMYIVGPKGQMVTVRTSAKLKDGWRIATESDIAAKVAKAEELAAEAAAKEAADLAAAQIAQSIRDGE
jgi:hypothetical protein